MPLDAQLSLVDESTLEARPPMPVELQPSLKPDLTIRRVSEKTAQQYAHDLELYLMWAKANGRQGLPAKVDDIADYIEALTGRTTKISTIRRRLAALVKWHTQRRIGNPRHDAEVRAALANAYKFDEAGYQRPYALVDGAVRKMIAAMNTTYQQHVSPTRAMTLTLLRNQAILLINFHAALTPTEITTLRIENFGPAPDGEGLVLRVNNSGYRKGTLEWANPLRTRDRTIRPALDPTMCAITALMKWLNFAGISEGFVFRSIDRAGNIAAFLTRKSIRDIVRYSMEQAGLEPDHTSGHSLRSGLAATLARNGAPDDVIKEATGLKQMETLRDVVAKARRIAQTKGADEYLKL